MLREWVTYLLWWTPMRNRRRYTDIMLGTLSGRGRYFFPSADFEEVLCQSACLIFQSGGQRVLSLFSYSHL